MEDIRGLFGSGEGHHAFMDRVVSLVDFPLSFVVDTVVLPLDLACVAAQPTTRYFTIPNLTSGRNTIVAGSYDYNPHPVAPTPHGKGAAFYDDSGFAAWRGQWDHGNLRKLTRWDAFGRAIEQIRRDLISCNPAGWAPTTTR